MYLIVGLGNPGLLYHWTRHNVGHLIVRSIAKKEGLSFKSEKRFKGKVASWQQQELLFLLPMTYMNLSGEAVAALMGFYKISLKRVLIVSDDADLPFGTLRLRRDGSSGGHRGLLSIEKTLGTREYSRLKVGVGRPFERGFLDKHVLGRFTSEEKEALKNVSEAAEKAILQWLNLGIEKAMNEVNRKEKK